MILLRLMSALGWRAGLGLAAGAALGAFPAYQTGRWVERATLPAQIKAAEAAIQLDKQEAAHERYRASVRARLDARQVDRAVGDAGGLSDDGWRRD